MNEILANTTIVFIISCLLISACLYIYREKKKGSHCIGCPMSGNCPRHKACVGHAEKTGINS